MPVSNEIKKLNTYITDILSDDNNQISNDISEYLSSKSKRIRPSLVFLFAKAMGIEISEKIYHLACSVELIHNSTLVHDDIIDNAETRRGKVSLNRKLGNSMSVLAGDILLSAALKELAKCQNPEIINIFADSLYKMCKGEINQDCTLMKLPTLDEYINKSEAKTAELFKAPLVSLAVLFDSSKKQALYEFAKNFGIAFQIKDDLTNILQSDSTKPVMSDIDNGIYTAPVIFLGKNVDNMTSDEIKKLIQNNPEVILKTRTLIKEYTEKAIKSIDFTNDNEFKQEIIRLINLNL